MGSAIARARAGLHDERDRALLLEIVTGTLRMQAAIDYQLAARVKRPLAKLDAAVLARPANERVPVDLPVAVAGIGGHQRRGRTDAAIRKIERGGLDQRRAASRVARSRRAVVAVAGERRSSISRSCTRIRAGSSSDGCSATANTRPEPWLAFNNEPAADVPGRQSPPDDARRARRANLRTTASTTRADRPCRPRPSRDRGSRARHRRVH